MNPVRAGMVDDPANYAWSSYQCAALGKASDLFTPHPEYLGFGNYSSTRMENYRFLFDSHVGCKLIDDIRESLQTGMALGDERFKVNIEVLCGRRVTRTKMGRSTKPKV